MLHHKPAYGTYAILDRESGNVFIFTTSSKVVNHLKHSGLEQSLFNGRWKFELQKFNN